VIGIVAGLTVGKPLGIMAAARGAVFANAAALPKDVSWSALHGCAWLGGMGFTMSLFIATLAFEGTPLLNSAKVGILAGSVAAGLVGAVVVRASVGVELKRPRLTPSGQQTEQTRQDRCRRWCASALPCGEAVHSRMQSFSRFAAR
jgi:hypothetical protein